jgi:beta-hydroxylase
MRPPKPPLTRAQKRAKAKRRRRELRRRRLREGGSQPGPMRVLRESLRAALLRIGKGTRPLIDGILQRYSTIPDQGFPDPSYFPWVPALEARAEVIRKEVDVLLQDHDQLPELRRLSPDHDRIADSSKWRAFFLMGYRNRAELGCRLCPETMRALDAIPNLESAFFSILMPGMHIRKHRGPTKSLITCHLALRVPASKEKCVIRVDDEIRPWQEGKCLFLDDTHKHEVWNETDEMRVVLLLHIRRPLRFPGSLVGGLIYHAIRKSPFVQDGYRNVVEWEKTYAGGLGQNPAH